MTQWTGVGADWRGRSTLGVTEVGATMHEFADGMLRVAVMPSVLALSEYRVPKFSAWIDGLGVSVSSGFALVQGAVYVGGALVAKSDQVYAISSGAAAGWYDFTFHDEAPGGVLVGGSIADPAFGILAGEDASIARISRPYPGAFVQDFSSVSALSGLTFDASSAGNWTVETGYARPTVATATRLRLPSAVVKGSAWVRLRTGSATGTHEVLCGAKSDGSANYVAVQLTPTAFRTRKVIAGVETTLDTSAVTQTTATDYWVHVVWSETQVVASLHTGASVPSAAVVTLTSAIAGGDQPTFANGQWGLKTTAETTMQVYQVTLDETVAGMSWLMDERFTAFSGGFPALLSSANASIVGGSAPTLYATLVPVWEPEAREEEGIARLGFSDAQAMLGSTSESDPVVRTFCGWHGTYVDANRGSFCVVRAGSELEGLVGYRVSIRRTDTAKDKVVVAYCVAASNRIDEDVSLTRRLYMALGFAAETRAPVEVRPLAAVSV